MTHSLHIDWTACRGRGACTELLDGLDRDEWGYPLAVDGSGSNVPVPRRDMAAAREAVALCPLQALSLHRSDAPARPSRATR
ncbi:ferredoxin [Microbacterium xanthum]|uniref:ferredoxin n=1 Tax=Microbacterium xanthum TaxID=3079794 RepID=UPI002AD5304A|nr:MULTISPECIES: ferredoxin [unclassified Microbacterium]MDZ8172197.1 ferredoxin [Microbacterium sp. KSW-48]MDZ8202096.1 ferredoxin [Microbacterium sp. SSW1-59]